MNMGNFLINMYTKSKKYIETIDNLANLLMREVNSIIFEFSNEKI